MKHVPRSAGVLLLVALLSPVVAQDPAAGGAPAKAAPKTVGESLAEALIQGDQRTMAAAVESVHRAGTDGRASLRRLVERIMPATAALPAPEKGAKPDPKAMSEPLSEDSKGAVLAVLSDDAAKVEEAQKKLGAASANAVDAQKLATRADNLLSAYVLRVFREQGETNAIYAGQFAMLRELGPAADQLLRKWITSPPPRMQAVAAKSFSIRALRDLVTEKADEALKAQLKKVASDKIEAREVSKEAGYALAQFGDRSLIDPRIAQLEEAAKSKTGPELLEALGELADTHYQLRDYEQAVTAFKRQIEVIEQAGHGAPANLPTIYYNACCSMALGGKIDEAFLYLDKAIEAGKKAGQNALRRRTVEVDMDIEALRKDPRFAKVLEKFGAR
jgi:tetratricopeptide (TPR) repeat protein